MYNVIYNTIYIKPCDSWKQRGVEMEEMEHSRAGILQILRRRKNLDKDHSSEDPKAPLEDRRTGLEPRKKMDQDRGNHK